MAIYHFTVKNGSRQKGQSAAAKSDYILREGKYASDHDEVAFSKSANMPEFAADEPRMFWQAADNHERANGRLFREIELSLPRELDLQQQVGSMERFAIALGLEKMPYTMAIHRGDGTNPHCHLMFSERLNDGIERDARQHFKRFNAKTPEQGGAQKTTEFRSKEWLQEARELWAQVANESLAEAGHDTSIDHRSLIDQGIDRAPQIHLGPAAHAMEQRGIETERGDELAEVMDVNDELAELAVYEEELEQEVANERSRQHPQAEGPEGGRGHDHAADRGGSERSEPEDERPGSGDRSGHKHEYPGREVDCEPQQQSSRDPGNEGDGRKDRGQSGGYDQPEPRPDFESSSGTPSRQPTGIRSGFSAWVERRVSHRVALEFDRLRSLISRPDRDLHQDLNSVPDPAPAIAPEDLPEDLQPAKFKPAGMDDLDRFSKWARNRHKAKSKEKAKEQEKEREAELAEQNANDPNKKLMSGDPGYDMGKEHEKKLKRGEVSPDGADGQSAEQVKWEKMLRERKMRQKAHMKDEDKDKIKENDKTQAPQPEDEQLRPKMM